MTASLMNSQYPQLPGFDKRNRELIFAMCDAGWTGRTTKKGHWLGKAPDATTTITVPAKDNAGRGLANAHAMFMRWLKNHMSPEIQEVWDAAVETDDPLLKDVLAESLVKKQAQQITSENISRAHEQALNAIKEGRIVIEPLVRPWLARKHAGKDGGTRYESQTTLEVVWPDGRTDYSCAFGGCDYISDKPRSVAQHYGQQHTRKGESEPAGTGPHHIDPAYTEPVTTRDYRPTERLLAAATEMIYGLMYEDGVNAQDLALAFLTWAHDRPDIEHTERPLVPLTDADILNKIRMLVGQPDQSEKIAQITRERDELAATLVRVERDLATLRELLEGVGK